MQASGVTFAKHLEWARAARRLFRYILSAGIGGHVAAFDHALEGNRKPQLDPRHAVQIR
jgi:hypothetical protein